MSTTSKLDRAVDIAKLALQFARVRRVTRHEDGRRPEFDSDHTVMLAILACDMAPEGLDLGLVAQFAIVHDLVEADPECGDTQTLTIDAAGREAKAKREAAAMERLLLRFGEFSWLGRTLRAYERQDTPEARYVRIMDKVTPKLTHMLNDCRAARELTDRDGLVAAHRQQLGKLAAEHEADVRLRPALDLLGQSMAAAEKAWIPDRQSAANARKLLSVHEPLAVAFRTDAGKLLDADGEEIDKRQAEPWVWALGPFGSWPETLARAEELFAEHQGATWTYAESLRLGWVVMWRPGWGFAAMKPEEARKL